jgi:hypothetical protein
MDPKKLAALLAGPEDMSASVDTIPADRGFLARLAALIEGGPAPMQPDLTQTQMGAQIEPGQTRRPNVLPLTRDAQTGQLQFAMPRFLDIAGNATPSAAGSALAKALGATPVIREAGEVVLGAGPTRLPKRGDFKRMTEVPNLRGLPVDEAVAIAAREPHLIPSSTAGEGAFVGGPRDVKSMRGLNKIRGEFDEYVAADPRGGDWYDRFRAGISEITGNDPVANTWVAKQEGQWSAGASPEAELAFALRENNAAVAGEPVKAGRPASHESFLRAIAENDPEFLARGQKTGEYAYRINPNNEGAAATATGVNDFRHQRSLGYTNADGSLPSSGNHIVQDTVHKFMDYETALAVKRANEANLGGRSDWTGEQIQAAPWVRQKALSLMSRNEKLSYDEAFERANTTIADFFPKHTAYATHEALPGPSTGHLPGLQAGDQMAKDMYALDPRSSWATAPGGRDAIYADMKRVDAPGVGARVRPSLDMQGVYVDEAGNLQLNKGQVARPLVAFETAGKGDKGLSAGSRGMLETGELTRAFIDAQDAGAAHANMISGIKGGMLGSVNVPMSRALTAGEGGMLRDVGKKYGLGDVVDRGDGVTMTSFYPDPPTGAALGKALRAKDGLAAEIRGILADSGAPSRVKTDGVYMSLTDAWKMGEGSGAATTQLLEKLDKHPTIRDGLNQSDLIAKKALANMERDKALAGNDTLRADIQNARRIIGEGPGWVDRLKEALARGELLPAVALPILAAPFLKEASEGRDK